MKNKVLSIVLPFAIVILLIGIFSIYLFANPKNRIMLASDYETGMFYLGIYDNIMSQSSNMHFLKEIIKDSDDVKTLNLISHYAKENKKCNLIPFLDKKCNHLKALKKDSVWVVNFNSSYSRESSREMIYFSNGLCDMTKELKNKCN